MMINKGLKMYRTYQRFLRTLLIICGCWYMPTKFNKIQYYWSFITMSLMMMYLLIILHTSYLHRYNLAFAMKDIGIGIGVFGAFLKITTFLINRASLIKYHRTLNDLFEEELTQNEKIQTIILSPLRKICTLAYSYAFFMLGLTLAHSVPPFLFIFRELCHFRLSTNYTLPLTEGSGYLWTVPDNFLYHFHLLFELGTGSLSTTTAACVDSLFGLYVYQFSSTMRAMTFRLMNPLPTETFLGILRTCVVKHQKLLQCRITLELIYGKIVFWHVISNAVLLCVLIYEAMLYSSFNIYHGLAFLSYTLVKMLQIFIYSCYGTVLTNADEDFRKGIYFSGWLNTNFNHHVRTNIILVMMQKPMTINTYFSPVDIVMFTNFVNTTISYFFLLQTIG